MIFRPRNAYGLRVFRILQLYKKKKIIIKSILYCAVVSDCFASLTFEIRLEIHNTGEMQPLYTVPRSAMNLECP